MTHIAMDVHQATSTLAYLTPGATRPQVRRVPTSPEQIEAVLAELPPPWVVAVEASRQSPAVCRWLQALGAGVHLTDPQQLHQLGQLQAAKTDGQDALVMLRALVQDYLPQCYLAEPEVEAQRALDLRGHHLRAAVRSGGSGQDGPACVGGATEEPQYGSKLVARPRLPCRHSARRPQAVHLPGVVGQGAAGEVQGMVRGEPTVADLLGQHLAQQSPREPRRTDGHLHAGRVV